MSGSVFTVKNLVILLTFIVFVACGNDFANLNRNDFDSVRVIGKSNLKADSEITLPASPENPFKIKKSLQQGVIDSWTRLREYMNHSKRSDDDEREEPKKDEKGDRKERKGFVTGFVACLMMIVVSEIGDKTFLITAIMAMKHSRLLVFWSAFSALVLMSVLSVAFGYLVPLLIPVEVTRYIAAVLFLVFGVKMVWEGVMEISSDTVLQEYEQVNSELASPTANSDDADMEAGQSNNLTNDNNRRDSMQAKQDGKWDSKHPWLSRFVSLVFFQVFTLVFLAEWGDRSQIATIALAAAENAWGVTAGAVVGHGFCTLLAVLSGKFLAHFISIKTVTICGGLLFIMFSLFTILL